MRLIGLKILNLLKARLKNGCLQTKQQLKNWNKGEWGKEGRTWIKVMGRRAKLDKSDTPPMESPRAIVKLSQGGKQISTQVCTYTSVHYHMSIDGSSAHSVQHSSLLGHMVCPIYSTWPKPVYSVQSGIKIDKKVKDYLFMAVMLFLDLTWLLYFCPCLFFQ